MATERFHVPMDRAGRVVLPKEIRDRFGVHSGMEFEVIEESDKIILKPVPLEAKLVKKDKWLVVQTSKPLKEDIVDLIRKSREERIRHVSRL